MYTLHVAVGLVRGLQSDCPDVPVECPYKVRRSSLDTCFAENASHRPPQAGLEVDDKGPRLHVREDYL